MGFGHEFFIGDGMSRRGPLGGSGVGTNHRIQQRGKEW